VTEENSPQASDLSEEIKSQILSEALDQRIPLEKVAEKFEIDVDEVAKLVEIELQRRIQSSFTLDKYTKFKS
jgi:hypothetical protein